jgi:hypothetical protein
MSEYIKSKPEKKYIILKVSSEMGQTDMEYLKVFRSNCSRNENVLKLPRHGVYDILTVKSHKKVGVTELVKKI